MSEHTPFSAIKKSEKSHDFRGFFVDASCTGVDKKRPKFVSMKFRIESVIRTAMVILGMIIVLLLAPAARAAKATGFSDTLSTLNASAPANHRILFVTPSGVSAPGATITLTFGSGGSFDLSSITVNDIDLAVDSDGTPGDCSGTFTDKTLGITASAGVWGAATSGQILTLTAPTNAAIGEIAAGQCARVLIGTNASFQAVGTNRIVNPVAPGQQNLVLGGTFGDFGVDVIPIVSSGDVGVTATVTMPSGGGGGGPPPPPVISNVRTQNVTETSADVLWETDIASTSFVDYGTTVAYGNTTSVGGQTFNHNVHLSGLTRGTTYHLRVRSTGTGTTESVSGDSTFATQNLTPPVISNVQASNITGTSAKITWDTDEDSTSRVDYGLSEPFSSFVSNNTLTNSHALTLAGLTPATQYGYRVTSVDSASNSATSILFHFTTVDTIPPTISSINVTNITESSAQVNWSTNKLADSRIDYGTTASYGSTVTNFSLVANHQIPLSGLLANTLYHFEVVSKNANGNAATSTDQTFSTLPDTTPPANVSNLSATPSNRQIGLSWINPPDTDFAGVRIRRSTITYPASPTSGTLVFDGSSTSVTDVGLTNGTRYYYTVFSYDTSANFASGAVTDAVPFRTTPPGPVSNFTASPGDSQITLSWVNPSDPEFSNVVIRRSTSGFPATPSSGTQAYSGSGQTTIDAGLTNGTTYYYSAFARDTSNNFSVPAQVSGTPTAAPPPPVCDNNGICEGAETHANCPADCPAPLPPPPGPVCGNGICEPGETHANCPADCPAPPPPQPPVQPPPQTAPPSATIDRSKIKYYAESRTVELAPDINGNLNVLEGATFSVVVPTSAFPRPVKSMVLNLGNNSYLFQQTKDGSAYLVDVVVPNTSNAQTGRSGSDIGDALRAALGIRTAQAVPQTTIVPGTIIVTYDDSTSDVISFKIAVNAHGYVYEIKNNAELRIDGASVALYKGDGGIWNAADFTQTNPIISGPNGHYGYMAPPGTYYLKVTKDGYRDRTTAPLAVADTTGVINEAIELVRVPPSITDVIIPGAPVTENIFNVAKNITEQTTYVTKVVQTEVVEDPRVKRTTSLIIVPAAAVVTTAVVATAVQATSFISYLYFLITQPILLIGRRRRKEYGTIYNALTKLPVDLAIVRLFRSNGKLVRTIVTDKQGRYAFLVEEGEYRMEATRQNFKFPSEYLKGKKVDGRYLDLYHGEIIVVGKEGAVITANIPMDPIEEVKSTRRIVIESILRRIQSSFAASSVLLTFGAALLYRQTYLFGMSALQLALYLLFRRLARPRQPKNWGIIYDQKTRKPVPFAVARIVESQYNKVLESRVTDSKGRYNFLVGNNKYFVSVEKPGYETTKTSELDLTLSEKGEGVISVDIPIKQKSETKPEEKPMTGEKSDKPPM